MSPADTIVLAITYLLVKHAIADFMLQTSYQWKNKGRYGHPGGILHALIHATFSAPVLLIMPAPTLIAGGALLLGEFLIHYHIDWIKEQTVKLLSIPFGSAPFWWAIGIDQIAHSLTYSAMTWLLIHPDRIIAITG